ncbi:hypothetical protein T459_29470 [Capsicum annuum]|uniref:EF-hand domain-containing protein n=1 Tax=Capsicum annuum TaxID=4072 RepID=A0A2G2Y5L7_CAPAN|nr:hypothetical protein T459_29470 [Capsicum annuum]
MYLPTVEEQSLGNHPNRLVLLALQWNLNLSLWIKPVKKQNDSEISRKIFLIGPNQWHQKFLSSGIITVDYVKSKDNVSDPLTKGLSREGVEKTSKEMGLRPRTSQHGDSETVFRNNTLIHEMMDVSGDGGIDIDEFDSLHQTIMDEHGEEEEDIREVFNMFNQNGYEFLCESCSCFVRTIDQGCRQMIKKNGH